MEHISTIAAFCALYGCSLESVCIPCLFCKRVLSFQDLSSFIVKHLNLVFRNYSFYAACTTCLRVSAAFEQRNYYQCTATAFFIQSLYGNNICDLIVRCQYCMKRLDCIEKLDCLSNGEQFHLVRGLWRSSCRLCKSSECMVENQN